MDTNTDEPQHPELLENGSWARLTMDSDYRAPWVKGALVQIVNRRQKLFDDPTAIPPWNQDWSDTDYNIAIWRHTTEHIRVTISKNGTTTKGIPSSHLQERHGNAELTVGDQVILKMPYACTYNEVVYTFEPGSRGVIVNQINSDLSESSDPSESVWDVRLGLKHSKWEHINHIYTVTAWHVVAVPASATGVPKIDKPESSIVTSHMWSPKAVGPEL